jgi:thiol:disulfide interchange protein DsbD
MLALAIALLIASVGAWLYGRWGAVSKPKKVRRIATLVTLVVIGLSFWQGARSVSRAYESTRVSSTSGTAENEWQAWSKAAVAEHLATGRPVFVDFTASWCLICQVNKRTVLRTASIEALFKEYDIATLQADWTTQDATITDALESYGRSGVPLYLLHLPNGETDILPQNLTKAIVREAVESKLTRGR